MDVMCNDGADAEESNCSLIENGQQAGLINSRQDQRREQRAERGHRQSQGRAGQAAKGKVQRAIWVKTGREQSEVEVHSPRYDIRSADRLALGIVN